VDRRYFTIGALLAAGGVLLAASNSSATIPVPVPGALPKTYDDVYRQHCPSIPVEYLRALAKKESDNNPRESTGGAWGLLQVVQDILEEYNQRYGTSYTLSDRLDPVVSVRMACYAFGQIIEWFDLHHQVAFEGGFNWANLRHVNLLTFAWNAGWSESRGVAGVIGYLEAAGVPGDSITIDLVRRTAERLTWTSEHVKRQDKVDWCKKVTLLYLQELRLARV